MSRQLPPIDLHAHISPKARPADLERLGAVVFAATRSLEEYESVRNRRDQVTVWGLGCHPGVPEAQGAFDASRFAGLLSSTAYVSEVGVDRRSKVPMAKQVRVLSSILDCLKGTPRIVSIHSSGAPGAVLDVLERHRIKGAVLHWWRGDEAQTRRALELGCWFSVNAASMKHPADGATTSLDRVFTETDHPSGDRGSAPPRQPGAVSDVETALAQVHEIDATAVRQQVWSNLVRLVDEAGVVDLLPLPVQRMLAAARSPGGAPDK
jgi:TatD DNase family protein